MRTTPLSLIAAALIVIPMAAQTPTPTTARTASPAPTATRRDTQSVARITEAQWDKLDAIRNRNAKEERAAQEAARLRREKMQTDIKAVLTPEQYAQFERRRGMASEDGMGMGMRTRGGRPGDGRRGGGQMMRMDGMHNMDGMHDMDQMKGMKGEKGMKEMKEVEAMHEMQGMHAMPGQPVPVQGVPMTPAAPPAPAKPIKP